jgi:hypothetical protein
MIFLLLSWQHPFARTFRSRHRDHFTLVPPNADTTSRATLLSGHRAPRQRPIHCRQRHAALGDLYKTIPDYSRSGAKSP